MENSSVVKIYIIRPKPGPVAKNAPRPSSWESNPGIGMGIGLLDLCSITELQKSLPTTWARVQYIYVNEMVMPVKYKGVLIIILAFILVVNR